MNTFTGAFLALGLTIALPVAVLAQDGAAAPAAQSAPAQPEATPAAAPSPAAKERKICRTERATGSLTRQHRICMTKAEWTELETATHKGVGEMQRGAAGGQCVSANPMTRAC